MINRELTIGATLKEARLASKLTQAALAERARLPLRTYQRLESGDPGAKVGSLAKVLQALGLAIVFAASARPSLDELEDIYGENQ